ncbi:MAG: tRNA (mo5U34)-methyltransferase [Gammaproteobacteria bacterium]|jgi:tRNA (mo5U34)-methyltransferase
MTLPITNFESLMAEFRDSGFSSWVEDLELKQPDWLVHHGDYARWNEALMQLPDINCAMGDFSQSAVRVQGGCQQQDQLHKALKGLTPWRKGPFQFNDLLVDSEWRSDFKWDRVLPHLSPLKNRRVLDIGCGNGYHCWRMLQELPFLVLGIEPSVLFNLQFQVIQKYLNRSEIHLLPIGIEDMPIDMNWFDTVFSMGVLYHRKSPIDHLYQLKSLLCSGGELCLETLVIDGGSGDVLVPKYRYARMKNVWFLPSAIELTNWLEKCGFIDVRIVDQSMTTIEEQRTTEWMTFESLTNCLDEDNPNLTVEGLPAPKRAILLAKKS